MCICIYIYSIYIYRTSRACMVVPVPVPVTVDRARSSDKALVSQSTIHLLLGRFRTSRTTSTLLLFRVRSIIPLWITESVRDYPCIPLIQSHVIHFPIPNHPYLHDDLFRQAQMKGLWADYRVLGTKCAACQPPAGLFAALRSHGFC